jgi:hypothetical protein
VGFGPRDCSDYQTGISIIPIERLTDADRKWMLTAEYGGTGGKQIEGGLVVEEPDIEIGAGVSSKGMHLELPSLPLNILTPEQQLADVCKQTRVGNRVPAQLVTGPIQPVQLNNTVRLTRTTAIPALSAYRQLYQALASNFLRCQTARPCSHQDL